MRGRADSHRLLRSEVDHSIKPAVAAESSKVKSINVCLEGMHKEITKIKSV